MKQKLLFLMTLLVLCVTGAWGDNYYILSGKCNVPLTAGMASAKNQVLKSNGATVTATTAISSTQTGEASMYYNSTSASYANLTNTSNYGTSSTSSRTISAVKISSGNTMTITLGSKTFTKMDVVYACASKDAKSITIDGTAYNTNDQDIHIASISKTFSTSVAIENTSNKQYNVIVILTEPTKDISFDLNGATGVAPATMSDGVGETITLPNNFTMYKDGETFKGWDANSDGVVDYAGGANYTVTADATLKAIFESNGGTTVSDRTLATAITFDFQRKNGAPTVTWEKPSDPTSGVWIAQANIAGKTIDVKMDWDVSTAGKINNSSWNDWSQLNNGTTFTIPSAEGATVDIEGYNDTDDATTVNGAVRTSVSGNTSHYEISSTAATATIVMSGKASYYRTIKVTLPGPTYTVTNTLTNVTKTTGGDNVMGGTEYTATYAAASGYALPASVTVTAGGSDITANCTWAKATGTLTIPAAYTTGNIVITIDGEAIAGSEIIKATLTSASAATLTGSIAKSAVISLGGADAGKTGYKFTGAGKYVSLTLADGYTFQEGDIVNIHITAAAGQGTIAIYDSKEATSPIKDYGIMGSEGDNKLVLTDDFNSKQAIYFVRTSTNSWNAHIDYISVTRSNAVITLNASGYATFSYASDFEFDGAKAYKMALDEGEKTIAGTEVSGKIAAGEGILLKGEAGAPVAITETTGAVAFGDNDLKGSTKSDGTLADKPTYCYVLSGDTFKKYTGATLIANKAYFEASSDLSAGRAFTIIFDDGETTSINKVEANEFVEDNKFYNLAGQQVAQPTKGLYIVNGKKVIIK